MERHGRVRVLGYHVQRQLPSDARCGHGRNHEPQLQKALHEAEKDLASAQNAYDLTYSSAKSAYFYDTGGSNDPSFTVWLGTPGGKIWASRLDADWTAVAFPRDTGRCMLMPASDRGAAR